MTSTAKLTPRRGRFRLFSSFQPSLRTVAGDAAVLRKAYIDGNGPGWRPLTLDDFRQRQLRPRHVVHAGGDDSLQGNAHRRRAAKKARAELRDGARVAALEVRPGTPGCSSGFPPEAIAKLNNRVKLPSGIEVQVLDHGYSTNYERQTGKKADWFTTNGDVFSVGTSSIKPFPPSSPDGRRSFPRKNLSKGVGEWNHYYIRGINGEVRLWVNGEEVSGGSACHPGGGYVCLESEGSPIDFKNLRLRNCLDAGDKAPRRAAGVFGHGKNDDGVFRERLIARLAVDLVLDLQFLREFRGAGHRRSDGIAG